MQICNTIRFTEGNGRAKRTIYNFIYNFTNFTESLEFENYTVKTKIIDNDADVYVWWDIYTEILREKELLPIIFFIFGISCHCKIHRFYYCFFINLLLTCLGLLIWNYICTVIIKSLLKNTWLLLFGYIYAKVIKNKCFNEGFIKG